MGETPRSEPKTITVTLNPSLDRTLTTHFLSLGYHNWATETTRLDPAGRGVNVSRALHAQGVPTHAIILIGHDATGRAYQALLAEEQYPISIIRRAGRTRSNIVIYDTGHNNQTVILEGSEPIQRADRQAVTNMLLDLINPGDAVVFAGSLPEGARSDTYALLTSLAETKGATAAVNAGGGEALQQSLQAHPRLIYLTQREMEGLFNVPVRAPEDVLYHAQRLREQGAGIVLVLMEQTESALLVTGTTTWQADWPEDAGTRSGRSEALIAGFLAARLAGDSLQAALHRAAASAAYTIAQVGNVFGSPKDIEPYMDLVTVTQTDV